MASSWQAIDYGVIKMNIDTDTQWVSLAVFVTVRDLVFVMRTWSRDLWTAGGVF